jgi:hypothetical protein
MEGESGKAAQVASGGVVETITLEDQPNSSSTNARREDLLLLSRANTLRREVPGVDLKLNQLFLPEHRPGVGPATRSLFT